MVDRSVAYRFTGDFKNLQAGLSAASKSVGDFGGKLTALDKNGAEMRQGLSTLGNTAGRVGLVMAAGLGASAKAAVDWESAWAGVVKTVDGSPEQLAALEGGLRELARTMPATHEAIAATAEAAGQLGVATADVEDFTKTMLMLGETTNLTADEAATSIAQMANVMGTSGDDIDNLGAALVALGNNGASTEAQILGMAQRIAGAGAQIGLAESDILGISNAAASMGIEVEAGGTAISRVFTDMAKATAQGGEDLDKFAEVAGVSAQEFATAFEETPAQAFAMFTEGLNRINTSGGDVFTTLEDIGLSDVRVSQALLSMSASGDLLTDSLRLGADAFAESTALTDEYAKRSETTAAQVQVAWNNIKDAGIEAGAVLLPVVSNVASVVGDMARAFGELPGPVKSATTGLAGIVAVLGGGLWFTSKVVGGIASTKLALSQLGVQAGTTRAQLTSLAKSGTAVALATGTIVDSMNQWDSMSRSGDVADATVKTFEDLADTLSYSNVGKYADELRINVGRLTEDLAANGSEGEYVQAVLEDLTGASQGFGAMLNAQASGIVPFWTGSAEKAYDARKDLNEILEKGIPVVDADSEAMAEGAMTAESFAQKVRENAAANNLATDAFTMNAAAAEAQAEALKDSRDAARQSAQSLFNLGDSLNDSEVSLGDWISQMEESAEALANFRRNANEAADRGLRKGLIKALQEAGEAGALRMGQLANATDEEIARANRAWKRGQGEVQRYTDKIGGVPRDVDTKVTANTGQASAAIDSIAAKAQALSSRNFQLLFTVRQNGRIPAASGPSDPTLGGLVPGSADGGSVPKTGLPYADRHLYMLADGEEIISNRHGEADAYRAANGIPPARRLANGGTTGGNGDDRTQRDIARGLKALTASLDRATDAFSDAKADRQAVISAVTSGLMSDPFAASASSNIFASGATASGIADPNGALRQQNRDAREYEALMDRFTKGKRGLSGAALAEVDTLAEAQALAGKGRDYRRTYQRLFDRRESLVSSAASANANGSAATVAEIRELRKEVRGLRQDVRAEEAKSRESANANGNKQAKAIRGAVGDSQRNSRGGN